MAPGAARRSVAPIRTCVWRSTPGIFAAIAAIASAIDAIDKKALDLFNWLDSSLDDLRTDATSRIASIRDAPEAMARRAQTAGNAHRAAEIRSAIDEFDECRHGNVIEMAARADEFSGAALGAQRVPNDRHIDTDLLWSWFQEQLMKADGKLRDAQDMSD